MGFFRWIFLGYKLCVYCVICCVCALPANTHMFLIIQIPIDSNITTDIHLLQMIDSHGNFLLTSKNQCKCVGVHVNSLYYHTVWYRSAYKCDTLNHTAAIWFNVTDRDRIGGCRDKAKCTTYVWKWKAFAKLLRARSNIPMTLQLFFSAHFSCFVIRVSWWENNVAGFFSVML